jgi:hypothetical protein
MRRSDGAQSRRRRGRPGEVACRHPGTGNVSPSRMGVVPLAVELG